MQLKCEQGIQGEKQGHVSIVDSSRTLLQSDRNLDLWSCGIEVRRDVTRQTGVDKPEP